MVTIKLKFRPSTTQGKVGRLYYQLTHQRKTRYLITDYRIFPDEWNGQRKELVRPHDTERTAYMSKAL